MRDWVLYTPPPPFYAPTKCCLHVAMYNLFHKQFCLEVVMFSITHKPNTTITQQSCDRSYIIIGKGSVVYLYEDLKSRGIVQASVPLCSVEAAKVWSCSLLHFDTLVPCMATAFGRSMVLSLELFVEIPVAERRRM